MNLGGWFNECFCMMISASISPGVEPAQQMILDGRSSINLDGVIGWVVGGLVSLYLSGHYWSGFATTTITGR